MKNTRRSFFRMLGSLALGVALSTPLAVLAERRQPKLTYESFREWFLRTKKQTWHIEPLGEDGGWFVPDEFVDAITVHLKLKRRGDES